MRPRLFFLKSLLCAGGLATLGTGCFSHPSASGIPLAARLENSERPLVPALPNPTKDEVALIDGRPFSISGFLALRSGLTHHATEAVFWVGAASLVLQNAGRARGVDLQTRDAVNIARYALGELNASEADTSLHQYYSSQSLAPAPAEVRKDLEQLLSSAIVRRNERVLSSLNQP